MREGPSAQEQVRELYAKTEAAAATATERMVQGDSFGELLSKLTENTMAVTRLGFDAMDMVVRNLRLAGRQDITRLGRQLARTEDKLEMVLQEVEALRGELDQANANANAGAARRAPRNGSSGQAGARRASGANGARKTASSARNAGSATANSRGARAPRS